MSSVLSRILLFLLYILALYVFMAGSTILTILYVYKYTGSIILTMVSCYITIFSVGKIIYDLIHLDNGVRIRYISMIEYVILATVFYMEVIYYFIVVAIDYSILYIILFKIGLIFIEVLLLYICKKIKEVRHMLEDEDNKIIKGVD